MHRPRFGSVFAAVAIAAAAVVPLFAAPAGAANTCDAGQFPASFAAQAGLKVDCHTDANIVVNHVEVHDAPDAVWHHGTSHNVSLAPASPNKATTAGSATIKFAAGIIQTRDLRHPINAFAGTASVFKGGTFITAVAPSGCTSTCTSATISQTAALTETTATVKIEHTTNRVLADATCAAGTNTVTSTSAKWTASDVGKSVSGGPFSSGTFVSSVAGNVATLNQTHATACVTGRLTTIGAATYSGGVPVLFNADPIDMQVSNTTGGGQGFTCAAGQKKLVLTAAAVTDSGGFDAGDVALPVTVKGSTILSTKIATFTSSTTVSLAANCPTGVSASAGFASIGSPGAGAAANNSPMMTLAAELNLSDALVKTQDTCAQGTIEGFEVVGGWINPSSSYAASTATPKVSVGQILFPTSVISFNGFVVPRHGGDSTDAGPHYDFSFPLLPTSAAVCTSGGLPTDPTQLAFGFNPVVKSAAPFLATGSGNPGDPAIRQLLPETGSFSQTIQLITNPSTVVATSTSTACVIGSDTSAPGLPCGDG